MRDEETPIKSLSWRVQLKSPEAVKVQPMALPKGHWMAALRDVKADDVFINQPYSGGLQKERFIYYDGLIPSPKAGFVIVTGDNVAIKNQAKYPLHDVTVVDLRDVRKIRVARLEKLDAGSEVKQVTFVEADQMKWPSDAVPRWSSNSRRPGYSRTKPRPWPTSGRRPSSRPRESACSTAFRRRSTISCCPSRSA